MNPAFAQLIYRPGLAHPNRASAVEALGDAIFGLVTGTIVESQEAGLTPAGDPRALMTMGWSLSRIAILAIAGPLGDSAV